MTYALARSLQTAVFGLLTADTGVTGLVGSAIYDALPTGALPSLYVTLGQETVKDRSDQTGSGAEHDFTVAVISDGAGFATAKDVASAISDALIGAELTLARGRLVGLWFLRAKASRTGTGDTRQIDLTFRARLEDA